jgi:hypothetical protein
MAAQIPSGTIKALGIAPPSKFQSAGRLDTLGSPPNQN